MSGSSDKVRLVAEEFVKNIRNEGKVEFSLAVRDVKAVLERDGFPASNTPQVCTAMRSRRFLEAQNLELVGADGPPSMQSTTVVFHYRFRDAERGTAPSADKDPRWKAFDAATGCLKDVFDEFGGGKKFLDWVRAGMDRQP